MGIVIGVFSAKGGVGKSLVASNMGAVFAVGHNLPTALIDLNAGLGAADLLLDLEPERSWSDLIPVVNELTTQHLNLAITAHESGLHLLACPEVPDAQANLTRESLEALLTVLKNTGTKSASEFPEGRNTANFSARHITSGRPRRRPTGPD